MSILLYPLTTVFGKVFSVFGLFLSGKASNQQSSAGRYVAVEGKWKNGREVTQVKSHVINTLRSSCSKLNSYENAHYQVLQLQHPTRKRFLVVPTGKGFWGIVDSLDTTSSYIGSASAGSSCPASSAAAVNKRLNWKSWQFAQDFSWHEAGTDIAVTCETPNICA